MKRPFCIGLAISNFEVIVARWPPGASESEMEILQIEPISGISVIAEPCGDALLPVRFRSSRAAADTSLDWLDRLLSRLRHTSRFWPEDQTVASCLSVLPGMPFHLRDNWCELGRRREWLGIGVVGHDEAIAKACLADSVRPATALLFSLEFDCVVVSLVTVLRGTVRARDQVRLSCFSQAVLDELLVAACLKDCPDKAQSVDWYARWNDAARIRQQLDLSTAAALELPRSSWPVAMTVDTTRSDLWPHLEPDCRTIIEAATELLAANQVSLSELDRVLLLGGSPWSWEESEQLFSGVFGAKIAVAPLTRAATGAALYAADLDHCWTGHNEVTTFGRTSSWPERSSWLRSQAAASCVNVAMENRPANLPATIPDSPAGVSCFEKIDLLENELHKLVLRDPEQTRHLAKRLLQVGQKFLEDTSVHEVPDMMESNSPFLDLAELALETGKLRDAVQASHQAYQDAPNNATIFQRMIAIHVEAATKSEADGEALEWLECAHTHDRSNRTIHAQLAERYRRHARKLIESRQLEESLHAARRSMEFDPFNEDASLLIHNLETQLGQQTASAPKSDGRFS